MKRRKGYMADVPAEDENGGFLKAVYELFNDNGVYDVFRIGFRDKGRKDLLFRLEESDGVVKPAEFEYIGTYNRSDFEIVEGGWPDRPVWKYERVSDGQTFSGLKDIVRQNVKYGDTLAAKAVISERAKKSDELGSNLTLSGVVVGIRNVLSL